MTIRINDAFKPGYQRTPQDMVRKGGPPDTQYKLGSAILNQAMADVLNQKSIAQAAPQGHRYWRINFKSRYATGGDPSALLIAEFRLYDVSDITGQGTFIGSRDGVLSGYGYHPLSMLHDSDVNSYWITNMIPAGSLSISGEWMGMDFGAGNLKQITYMRWFRPTGYWPGPNAYCCASAAAEWSDDGSAWHRVGPVVSLGNGGNTQGITLDELANTAVPG